MLLGVLENDKETLAKEKQHRQTLLDKKSIYFHSVFTLIKG